VEVLIVRVRRCSARVLLLANAEVIAATSNFPAEDSGMMVMALIPFTLQ
jgi:hypothetical protein